MTDQTAEHDPASNYVCGRFLWFRDGTGEAQIVESGTQSQCQFVADNPSSDIDRSAEGWVRAQAFKVMTAERWNALMEESDRYESEH